MKPAFRLLYTQFTHIHTTIIGYRACYRKNVNLHGTKDPRLHHAKAQCVLRWCGKNKFGILTNNIEQKLTDGKLPDGRYSKIMIKFSKLLISSAHPTRWLKWNACFPTPIFLHCTCTVDDVHADTCTLLPCRILM